MILKERYSSKSTRVVSGASLDGITPNFGFIADYAVYVTGQSNPSLVVETKMRMDAAMLHRLINCIRRLRFSKGNNTHFILAIPNERTGESVFYDLTSCVKEKPRVLTLDDIEVLGQLPDLGALKTAVYINNEKRVKKRINIFKWTCRVLAGMAAIIVVLDSLAIYELSWERLVLLAVVVLLMLLPYVNLIRYKDYELSFLQ